MYIIGRARLVAQAVDRNFVTALVFLAITRTNVSGITASRANALRHLGADDIPPDSHRLPVTIYALSRDLRIPYETVRRHVAKLKSAGLCIGLAGGVIVPSEVFRSPMARAGAARALQSVCDFVNTAAQSGVVADRGYEPIANDVTLQIARLSTDYFVEAIRLIGRRLGLDVLEVLLMMTAGLLSVEAITRDPAKGVFYGGLANIPTDDLRDPVSVYAVSKFLMLPYETARRSAARLVTLGLLARNQFGGLTMPSAVVARPEMLAVFSEFAALTLGFLGDLAEYGVAAPRDACRAAPQIGAETRLQAWQH